MKIIADLHIHSRFSRATSKALDFVSLHRGALEKGIGLLGTGDFTHPGWMREIEAQLIPAEEGLFKLRPDLVRQAEAGLPKACAGDVRFVLQVEISNIYKKGDRTRKNHNLVFVPTLEAAQRLAAKLAAIGNIASDGRPILGLDARDLLEITLATDPLAFLVPAHIWTPWFSALGSKSGFDSIDACFGDLAGEIFAVETGLSSDPPMNWRLAALDRMTLISNSDAHSAAKLGREANLLDISPAYQALWRALKWREGFLGTIEFFPEEGKYHLDGHRKCAVRLSPEETRALSGRCPTCGGALTVGVMSRVIDLADSDRPEGYRPAGRPAFESLVPMAEVCGEVLGVGPESLKASALMARVLTEIGPELTVLKDVPIEDIEKVGGPILGEAIRRIRCGELAIAAGYDGEFGKVKVFQEEERRRLLGQMVFLGIPGFARKEPVKEVKAKSEKVSEASATGDLLDTPLRSDTRTAAEEGEQKRNPLFQLNPDQRQVATSIEGPLLVVAGPGTGKTRTLVARIAHLVRTRALRPEQVLAITFTNQAAEELRDRLDKAVEDQGAGVPLVTTFHGFGQMVLRDEVREAPVLLDDEARRRMAESVLGEDADKREVDRLLHDVSLAKQSPDPVARFPEGSCERERFDRYEALLAEQNAIDVDDLVLRAYRLLASDKAMAARLAARFPSVSVDEYQDINGVQAALIKLIAPLGKSLLAIGDPDQAIYGFRGAEPGHFRRFEEAFPGARIVSLGTTYRLTKPIRDVAESVLTPAATLTTAKSGPRVEVVACPSEDSEAEQIVVRIEQLMGGTSHFSLDSGRGTAEAAWSLGFGELAVLTRLKRQQTAVTKALHRSGIPFRVIAEEEPHDPRSAKVAVMTMHASKGREFEVVFVTGVEPGLMPLDLPGLLTDPAEERRLLYVAITRGKQLLVMSYAEKRLLFGKPLPGGPSPFIAHLPVEAVVHLAAKLPERRPTSSQLALF